MAEEAFVYWPDIEGLHHVLRNLSRNDSAPASVGYKGKIKLHGCNGAITISADSTVRVQSRNRFIDEENKGLAKWAKANASYFASLWPRAQSYLRRDFGASATSLTVFGEWCGPGVQKGSEVAIGKLDKCIFAVFSLYIDNYLMIEPDDIKTLLGAYSLPDGMHVIPWGFGYMRLHLGDEQLLEGQLPKINAIVDEVDRFDPWVFQEFNIRGPGEGVVWYPVDLADRKVGSFKDLLSVELFSAYAFKTKGKTHQMVKKKDAGGNATANEAVSIHVDVVDSEEELAELFLSEARYEQALQEVSSQNGDGRQHTTIEAIAQWMVKDVRKEAKAEFESASRPLRWEAVDRAVTKKVEQWAKSSENGPRVKAVMKELKANQASKYSSPSSSSSPASSPFKWFDQEDSASSSSSSSFSASSSSSSAPSDLFAGLVFSFSEHFAFKRKSELTDQIKRHGGTISYMLNDRCTHLVATPKEVADNLSGKIRQARKFVEEGKKPAAGGGADDVFHVIAGEWLDECLRQGVRVKEYPAFDLLAQLRLGASKAQDATEGGGEEQTSATTERKKIPQASVWSYGGKVEPYFPASNYDLLRMDVLHCMDIKDNHNKFYSMELHMSNEYVSPDNPGRCIYRILTHHGRTDDLDSAKTQIGQKETRYLQSLADAELLYDHVMAQKMADEKGYKHVDLVSISPKIGSDKNAERNAASSRAEPERRDGASALPQEVQRLVKHLYDQASESVSKTVVAKITTRGIETPLGILSRKQIQRGEDVLAQLNDVLAAEGADADDDEKREARIVRLSQDFYSMIPHRLGTTKEEVHKAVISNLQFLEEKQDLLQLMKDIIETSNMRSRTSATSEIDRMYNALQCSIKPLDKSSAQYREIQAHFLRKKTSPPVVAQLHDAMTLEVANVFAIDKSAGGEAAKALARRSAFASFSEDDEPADHDAATANNKRLLFHASKVFNFVGLLSRGILPPKVVVSKGLSARTDFGYLGQGIYFSDNSYSSVKYTNLPAALPTTAPTPPKGGKRRGGKEQQVVKKAEAPNDDRFMLLVDVELGRMMDYRQITPHLTAPPQGFDSCHGVAATPSEPSDFVDDEYVIYDSAKQQLRYLVQFSPTTNA